MIVVLLRITCYNYNSIVGQFRVQLGEPRFHYCLALAGEMNVKTLQLPSTVTPVETTDVALMARPAHRRHEGHR